MSEQTKPEFCTAVEHGTNCPDAKTGPAPADPSNLGAQQPADRVKVADFDKLFAEMDAAMERAGFTAMDMQLARPGFDVLHVAHKGPALQRTDIKWGESHADAQASLVRQINDMAKREHRHKLWHRIIEAVFILALVGMTMFFMSNAHGDTLRWTPPTQNTDGSALTNLAGYDILYGSSPTSLTNKVTVNNPAATSYEIAGTYTGTRYYAIQAFNTAGVRSANSSTVSKTSDGPPPPPLAVPAPPSSLAVVGRTVYQLVQQTDRLVFLPVGTVKESQECLNIPVGDYFVVPRSAVSWYGSVRPTVVVTKCN